MNPEPVHENDDIDTLDFNSVKGAKKVLDDIDALNNIDDLRALDPIDALYTLETINFKGVKDYLEAKKALNALAALEPSRRVHHQMLCFNGCLEPLRIAPLKPIVIDIDKDMEQFDIEMEQFQREIESSL